MLIIRQLTPKMGIGFCVADEHLQCLSWQTMDMTEETLSFPVLTAPIGAANGSCPAKKLNSITGSIISTSNEYDVLQHIQNAHKCDARGVA